MAARNIDPSILPWVVDESDIQLADNTSSPEYDMNMRNYLSSKPLAVKEIRELRQQTTEGGSTLEVIFDLKGTGLTYTTAANSAIYATNTAEDVEKFAKMFSLNLDTTFVFSKNAEFNGKMPKMPFPTGNSISFREALTKHIDFTAPISKKMLTAMAPLCEAKEDREL